MAEYPPRRLGWTSRQNGRAPIHWIPMNNTRAHSISSLLLTVDDGWDEAGHCGFKDCSAPNGNFGLFAASHFYTSYIYASPFFPHTYAVSSLAVSKG
mmetsp:Transcript_3168/g.5348  ORF Transcript_3168/g.5348 Transcript_3168/m.5348 type:complete len:97 (+) Transcript_3168:305-595(+)